MDEKQQARAREILEQLRLDYERAEAVLLCRPDRPRVTQGIQWLINPQEDVCQQKSVEHE